MRAAILAKPATFDRVDRVKAVTGQLPNTGDDKLWILGDTLFFETDGTVRCVLRGFTTDGASIPRAARALTGWQQWDEPQRWAAIVHDWLYCQPEVAKSFSDQVFRELLRSEGANTVMVSAMYWAVRLFARRAYRLDQASAPMIYDEAAPS